MKNLLENLVVIYSADEGCLKILLKKKMDEPYKNYWYVPGEILDTKTTLEESSFRVFKNETGVSGSNLIQGNVFSNIGRGDDNRIIAFTNIIITDKSLVDIKKTSDLLEWFDVDELPKLAFDHKDIILKVTEEIKSKIALNYSDIILDFFPSDFTLTDFQSFYENMIGRKMDRRNFRKKIFSQDLVVDTGEKDTSKVGRPGILYRFNVQNMKGKRL